MLYSLIRALRTGIYPDIDVYDTAAWTCIVELSDRSARNRSHPVDIPDLTCGKWKTRKPLQLQ